MNAEKIIADIEFFRKKLIRQKKALLSMPMAIGRNLKVVSMTAEIRAYGRAINILKKEKQHEHAAN